MMPSYSRDHPSPRYFELIEQHTKLHMQAGVKGEMIFAGEKMIGDIDRIKEIILSTGSQSILDYGSGKGRLYHEELISIDNDKSFVNLHDFWGIKQVTCYDPCYPPYCALPSGNYDGVICIDVLEHCPVEDISWIIREIFEFATIFVYVNVACDKAVKKLPNESNVHVTVREPDWWHQLFLDIASKFPEVRWELVTTKVKSEQEGIWFPVQRFGNCK